MQRIDICTEVVEPRPSNCSLGGSFATVAQLTISYVWSIISFPSSEASVIQGLPEETENISSLGPWTQAGYGAALVPGFRAIFFQQGWWELRDPCSQLQKGLRDTRRKLRPKCPGIKTSFHSGPPQCRCWSPSRAGLLLTPMDSVLQWRCKASSPWTHTWPVPADFWALIPHESQQVELIPAGLLAPSPLSRKDAEICPASPVGAAG